MRNRRKTLKRIFVTLISIIATFTLAMQVLLTPKVLTSAVTSIASQLVDGNVSFANVKANVFKSFPNLSVTVDDFAITYPHDLYADYDSIGLKSRMRDAGRNESTDTLASFGNLNFTLHYTDALSGRWHLRQVSLSRPRIFLHKFDSTAANWNILRFLSENNNKEEESESSLATIVVNRIKLSDKPVVIFTSATDTIFAAAGLNSMLLQGNVNSSSLFESQIQFSLDSMKLSGRLPSDTLLFSMDRLGIRGKNGRYSIKADARAFAALASVGRLALPMSLSANADISEKDGLSVSVKDMKFKIAPLSISGSAEYLSRADSSHLDARIAIDETPIQEIADYFSKNFPILGKLKTDASVSLVASCNTTILPEIIPTVSADIKIAPATIAWEGLDRQGRLALDFGMNLDRTSRLDIDLGLLDLSMAGASLHAIGKADDLLSKKGRITLNATASVAADTLVNFITNNDSIDAHGAISLTLNGKMPTSALSGDFDNASIKGRIWSQHLGLHSPSDSLECCLINLDMRLADMPNKLNPDLPPGRRVLGLEASADSLSAFYGKSTFIRGSGITFSGQPIMGKLQVRRLSLMGEDSLFVGVIRSDNSFRIASDDKHKISISSNNGGMFLRSGVNRVALRNAALDISASRKEPGKNAIREHRLDSLQKIWPGVPRDSLFLYARNEFRSNMGNRKIPDYLSDSTFLSKDISIDLGESVKEFFRQWQIGGGLSIAKGRIMTPYFPLDNNIDNLQGSFDNNMINLAQMTLRSNNSDISVSGTLSGLNRVITGTRGRLSLNLDIASDHIDADTLFNAYVAGSSFQPLDSGAVALSSMSDEEYLKMVTSDREQSDTSASIGTIVIPSNLNAKVSLRCKEISWPGISVNDLNSDLVMKERTLQMTNTMATSDIGDINFEGFYSSKTRKDLTAGFDLNLVDISADKVIQMFPAVDSIMPLLKSFNGMLNCRIAATSSLDPDMNLIFPSLNGIIRINGTNLSVKQEGAVKKLARTLMFKKHDTSTISDMSVEGIIGDNTLKVFPFVMNIDRYTLALDGYENFGEKYKYHVAVLKSPIPIRFGITFRGNKDDSEWYFAQARYKNTNVPVFSKQVDTVHVNLLNSIHNIFDKGVDRAVQDVAKAKANADQASREAGFKPEDEDEKIGNEVAEQLKVQQVQPVSPIPATASSENESLIPLGIRNKNK